MNRNLRYYFLLLAPRLVVHDLLEVVSLAVQLPSTRGDHPSSKLEGANGCYGPFHGGSIVCLILIDVPRR